MSWVRMNMRFPGKCIQCGKMVGRGELGLWSKGVGVKHERCGEDPAVSGGIACAVCGGPAGCNACPVSDSCDIPNVSQLCICSKCESRDDSMSAYVAATGKKFPALDADFRFPGTATG